MNLGNEYQNFLIFIALIIASNEVWATKVPTKFITGNEGGRWSLLLRWEPSLTRCFDNNMYQIYRRTTMRCQSVICQQSCFATLLKLQR